MSTRIVVAMHPGVVQTSALERARAIVEKTDAEVLLYSAVSDERIAGLSSLSSSRMRETREALISARKEQLDKAAERLSGNARKVVVEAEWRYRASRGIVEAAAEFGADLIIVSTSRHAPVSRWGLTNTDWHILRLAPVPVLFARHHQFRPYAKVLAAVDPTHSHDKPAALDHLLIERGKWICNLFDGELFLGHGYPRVEDVDDVDWFPQDLREEGWRIDNERAVAALATQHGIDESRVRLVCDSPKHAIPDIASELSADLVVIGILSRRHAKDLWVSRTSEHVIDHVQCDVLTIRTDPSEDTST